MSDVLITPASKKIEFKDASSNIDGTIKLDANDNLVLTSANDLVLGDGSTDLHIGDGTNSIDMVFDQAGRIYGAASKDITIGKSSVGSNDIIIDSPNWSVSQAGAITASSTAAFTGSLTINYAGSDTYADIIGPNNRDLRFVLRDNGDGDSFLFRNAAGTDIVDINRTGKVTVSHATDPIIRVQDTTDNYASTLVAHSTGAWLGLGDIDSSDTSWMKFGAFSGTNNLDTKDRDFHLFGTNTATGFYFDESAGKFGIGDTTPTATLEVAGDLVARRTEIVDISSNTNLSGVSHAGRLLRCTSACTLNLQASPTAGEQQIIYNDSTGTITISANGSDTINGSTNDVTITSRYKAVTVIAVSTSAWLAIGA